jgi:hypothetical protein
MKSTMTSSDNKK